MTTVAVNLCHDVHFLKIILLQTMNNTTHSDAQVTLFITAINLPNL